MQIIPPSIRATPIPSSPFSPAPAPSPVRGTVVRPPTGVRKAVPAGYRKGGRVKRTGWAKVHKGEKVVPASAASLGAGKKRKRAKKTKEK